MSLSDWFKKIQDIVMPIEPIPEDEDEAVENKTEAKATEQPVMQMQNQTQAQSLVETMAIRRAAGGNGGSTVVGNVNYTAYKDTNARPNLKLIKAPEFVMKVYQPADYSQINGIADDILAHKASVVNYEYVHADEQRRICDYIDGVCYAVDGTVTQISEKIFLYVPAGISTSDIAALDSSVRYH